MGAFSHQGTGSFFIRTKLELIMKNLIERALLDSLDPRAPGIE